MVSRMLSFNCHRWVKPVIAALFVFVLSGGPGLARNQWDINHGGNNPPQDPRFAPGGVYSGYVPQFTPDFWTNALSNRIPIGTVLSVILEDDLSSAKNKAGDTFTLTLQDGFVLNGHQLVPPNSKIIGTVNSVTPAKSLKGGHPGKLQISLQSLVFPDGRHIPLYAFIDCNPNHMQKQPPKVRHLGKSIADYGESVGAMFGSILTGPGFMMNKRNRGLDFTLDKGEVLPVRLTRTLIIPESQNLIAQPPGAIPASSGGVDGKPLGGSASGGSPSSGQLPFSPQPVPGLIDPSGPVQIPAQSAAPVPSGGTSSAPFPPGASQGDPDAIFNRPLNSPQLQEMPDPF